MKTFDEYIAEGLQKFKATKLNDKDFRVVITDYRGVSQAIILSEEKWNSLKKNEEVKTMFGNYTSITWKKVSATEMEYVKSSLLYASGISIILPGDEKFRVKFIK